MKSSNQQITTKLSEYQIQELALRTSFQLRKVRKVDSLSFVAGFFLMLCSGRYSLVRWAAQISSLVGRTVSKQAVLKKLQFRHEAFAQGLLAQVLRQDLQRQSKTALNSGLFKGFRQVYVEDSTCAHLPDSLAEFFPGSHSHKGNCATARIQLRLNLLDEQYSKLELQSYRDNDQKYAGDILNILQPGDLVIRDMGYWALPIFKKIAGLMAFFLSRYRYGANLHSPENGEIIDLAKQLRACRRKGLTTWDQWVIMGKEAQLPVRVVAILAPQQVAQSRKRKAAKDRHQRANHSKEYMELLSWTIFVTNVEEQTWTAPQVLQAYGFRWRIEIVFKCWKSKLGFAQMFSSKKQPGPAQALIVFHLFLAWLCLFFVRYYSFFLHAVFQSCQRMVSLMKFADFFKEHFIELVLSPDPSEFLGFVAYFCTHEKRKARPSQLDLLYMKN